MAFTTIPEAAVPMWGIQGLNATALSGTIAGAYTLDGASDAGAWVGDPPATGNLTDIAWRLTTTAITSGPLNFDFRVEQLTNMRPNGTLWDNPTDTTNVTVSIADTDDNVWKSGTLTAAASVTVGTPIGIVFKAPAAGTFSVVPGGVSAVMIPGPTNYPVVVADTNGDGTYDAAVVSVAPSMLLKIGGVWYSPRGCGPWDSFTYAAFNSGSSPDEKALRWNYPLKVRCVGMRAFVGNVAAGADFSLNIFPDSASAQTDSDRLATATVDGDAVAGATQDSWVTVRWAGITLEANTTYWAGVRADTANNISLAIMATPSGITGSHAATPGGTEMSYGTRAWAAGSANAYTPDENTQPLIQLLIDGIDTGGGSDRRSLLTGGIA